MLKPQVQKPEGKEEALERLGIAPPKGASAQVNPKLSDIANVINGIENQTQRDSKINFLRTKRTGVMLGAAEAARDFYSLQERI